MDSGVFALPHFHLALPLPADFVLGFGLMPEYGLGSKYSDGWTLEGSSTETTVTSFSLNPNIAWRITDQWSIGVGLRFVYFDFEQYSTPLPGGLLNHRLKGDNNMNDFGYQIGTKYDLTDNFSVGVVYKSLTVINVHGKSEQNGSYLQSTTGLGASRTEAQTDLELPQSITGGFNWDITPEVHLGGTVGWTQWSSVDTLLFNLGGRNTLCKLDWNDTWRVGLAPSWDFAEDWTAIMSYVFENDCCGDQESTMLPAANRHMLSWGLAWECLEELELALTYGMILMDGQETQSYGYKADPVLHRYKAFRGISHAAGLTLTYRF